MTDPSYLEFAQGYLLERRDMPWFRDHYVPEGVDRMSADVSPLLRPDLAGMPPAVIVTAQCDGLRDEAKACADRLREADNVAVYRCHPGVVHGFMALPGTIPQGQKAIEDAGAAVLALIQEFS